MPRALLLLALLAGARLARAADVFVIADTANQTRTIADAAKDTIAEANDIALAANDTVADSDDEHEPVVRKKRTFGDVVFRGLADVLGYNVARKPPQPFAFPPPVAPVPGIDAPIQAIPFALYPVVAAGAAPAPAPAAPPCGAPRAVAPLPCRAQAPPPPPPPKPTPPPCPRPRANPRPKPKPAPKPRPPPPPPPCAKPRANPTTPSPCAPPPPPPPPPKADPNLETITSNFRLDFNFNRAQATAAPAAEEEQLEEQEQPAPVAIQPRAAQLPLESPRTPRVYLDAFVVRNGVAQKVHAVDARNLNNLNQNQADDDYLVYDDEEQPQQDQDDEYEYVEESRDRAKAVREFGNAVDRFWEQKQKKKPKKKRPANDYRNVHFGDRDFVNQLREQRNEKLQNVQKSQPKSNRIPLPLPENEEEDEVTTTTQDPRRRLKPRVLPPTEQNPNQIDTVTVRVPPIYKEKHPKKLHRERPERPDRDEEEEVEEARESGEQEYSSDSDSENSDTVSQTEKPKRKRRRKQKRKTRSTYEPPYSAGDYDYYGKQLPISKEEKYYRGLTIPTPTRDADLARLEEGEKSDDPFLDDHERLSDDPERIKTNKSDYDKERADDSERADESERVDDSGRSYKENERTGESERSDDETERTDKLSPNARVRETNYQNNYVRATNVQVDDPRPLVANVKKKSTKIGKA